ncbi:MAG: helix-turn-helix transcriptional regulator [Terriglobales bacterium]
MRERLGSDLRRYRIEAGLTQEELAAILGYDRPTPVSRHERLSTLPPLLIAISYSVVFRKPIPELFPGLVEAVERATRERLAELATKFKGSADATRESTKKLEWIARHSAIK